MQDGGVGRDIFWGHVGGNILQLEGEIGCNSSCSGEGGGKCRRICL